MNYLFFWIIYIWRAITHWINEGEKPTQYFLNLESYNYASKVIPKIEKENGDIITDQAKILDETHNYYQNLYNANPKLNDVDLIEYLPNSNNIKLNDSDSKKLEGEITSAEAAFTLKNMKNNRSPGSSGFTCEFFKCFWKQLGSFVVRSINYAYFTG